MMLVGSLSLAGFPFRTGYYSKDFFLELPYVDLWSHSFERVSPILMLDRWHIRSILAHKEYSEGVAIDWWRAHRC
jgi:NADH:ubiquinone oxidoreductase subunit 5 (subunit L)/multisubunit Na+/H+ antiporter MnhA subunit